MASKSSKGNKNSQVQSAVAERRLRPIYGKSKFLKLKRFKSNFSSGSRILSTTWTVKFAVANSLFGENGLAAAVVQITHN
jgi:hypothetical protein